MLPTSDYDSRTHSHSSGEVTADYRARVTREQAENVARRQEELLEQASVLNTPEARVRIWERLHSLDLPRAAAHPLLRVVATQTGLTMEQVREEQLRRNA